MTIFKKTWGISFQFITYLFIFFKCKCCKDFQEYSYNFNVIVQCNVDTLLFHLLILKYSPTKLFSFANKEYIIYVSTIYVSTIYVFIIYVSIIYVIQVYMPSELM